MKIIVLEPLQRPTVRVIKNFDEIKEIIGGWVEQIPSSVVQILGKEICELEEPFVLLADEEGNIKGKTSNRGLVGTLVICKFDGKESLIGLDEADIEILKHQIY